jgi:hypothetical protein
MTLAGMSEIAFTAVFQQAVITDTGVVDSDTETES